VIVLAYLGSQCTKCRTAGRKSWCFTSSYLESCIRPHRISRWIRQRNSIQLYANVGKSATETLETIRQAFGDESIRSTRKLQTLRDWERRDWWEEKSRECSSFSLTSRGVFTRNSSWQVKLSIPRDICDILRRLPENLWVQLRSYLKEKVGAPV
jgi:hypothetical protein